MNKKELLKHFNVSRLAEISDKNLIKPASEGKLGRDTKWSALSLWAYDSEHEFTEHVRNALEKGKQVRTYIIEGEHHCPDKIEIDYV